MFDWFKSKKVKTENEITEKTKKSLTSPEELRKLIKTDLQKIESTEDEVELAKLYEQVGIHYSELNLPDEAIEYLEKSQGYKPSMGEGYKKLMMLYNAKRAEAAKNRDDAGID